VNQSLLCRRHVALLAMPNLQSRILDGSGKRKCQRPRHLRLESDIHSIQTGRGQFSGLATRQERNSRNSGGDKSQETPHRGASHLVHRFLLGADPSRKHHVRLQYHAFLYHPLFVKLVENCSQDFLRDFATPLQGMPAVHEHFWFDNGDQTGFLA
jgi:hypothetical protein